MAKRVLIKAVFLLLEVPLLGWRRGERLLLRLLKDVGVGRREDIVLIWPAVHDLVLIGQPPRLLALKTELADVRQQHELVVDDGINFVDFGCH